MKSLLMVVLILVQFALVACGGGGGGGGAVGGGDPTGGSSANGMPDLVLTAFSAPSTAAAGGTYTVTGTITNQGSMLAAGSAAQIYLSPVSDVAVDGGLVGMDVYVGFLESGQSWNFSTEVHLPSMVANGDYFIGAVATYGDESNTSNNTRSQAITITGGATCTSDGYEIDDTATSSQPLIWGDFQEHNHCEATSDWMSFNATGGTAYGISTTEVGDRASTAFTVYDTDGSTILTKVSSTYFSDTTRLNWTAPSTGTYYLKVSPSGGTLNSGARTEYHVSLGDVGPDLVVEDLYASNTGLPGGIVYVSDTVRNQGFAAAGSFDVSVYISTDPAFPTNGTLIGTRIVDALDIDQTNTNPDDYYTLPANLAPGDYYLTAIVNPAGTLSEAVLTNNLSVASPITVEPLGSCTPDAYEEDDSVGGAETISVGAVAQSHNHCEDDVDWLSFTAQAGQDYAVRVTRSGLSKAWVEIYDSDGITRLAGDGINETTALDWQAPANGTYYLKMGSYAGRFGEGRDYTVLVQPKLPDLEQSLILYNGDTVIAGGFLEDVDDVVSNVGYQASGPFEIGFYYSANNVVTTSSTLSATRSVADLPSGPSYVSSDHYWGTNMHFPKTLTPGTYYIAAIADRLDEVVELDESNNASTPVAVTVVAPECPLDAYEDDDEPATAQAIVEGETQTRNFCDDRIDWIKFTPSTDGVYLASDPMSYGTLTVYQADGITEVTPHDTYFYSKLSWQATAGSDYYLKYSDSRTSAVTYDFNVSRCIQDAFEEDDTLVAANDITLGETQTRNHCEDNEDWAKFTADAGITYTIRATNAQSISTYLYDGVSSYSLASGQSVQGGQVKEIQWTAPANGTYYIQVHRFEFGQNTEYTLTLN